jgi:hypothetical protein
MQDPKRALAAAPWHLAEALVDTASTSDLAAMLVAHGPSTCVPPDRKSLLDNINANHRCRSTLQQAGLAAATLALLLRLTDLRRGRLPTEQLAMSAVSLLRGKSDSASTSNDHKSSSTSKCRQQTRGSRSGIGYEGDQSDSAVVAKGMHAKDDMHKATLEELRCSVVALYQVILQSSQDGMCPPVCSTLPCGWPSRICSLM